MHLSCRTCVSDYAFFLFLVSIPRCTPTDGCFISVSRMDIPVTNTVPALPLSMSHPSDVLDMPVDPNEPTYCLCHQVSYGEMIGCDNPDVSLLATATWPLFLFNPFPAEATLVHGRKMKN